LRRLVKRFFNFFFGVLGGSALPLFAFPLGTIIV
jgi:hypothetical protein